MLMEIGAVVLGRTVWTHVRSLPPIQGVQQPGEGWKLLDVWDKRLATYASCSQKEKGVGACSRFLLRKAAERRIRGSLQSQRRGRLLPAPTKTIPSRYAVRPYHQKERRRPNWGPVLLNNLAEGDQWLHASPQAARELARLDGVTDPFRGFGGQCSQQ